MNNTGKIALKPRPDMQRPFSLINSSTNTAKVNYLPYCPALQEKVMLLSLFKSKPMGISTVWLPAPRAWE